MAVTWGAIGTGASGTTSCTPSYPSGISADTSALFCVVTGRSNTADTAFTMPAGWTSLGQFEGGTGTWAVDAGTRRVAVFRKDTVTGSESGTVTVSLTGTTANTMRASIVRLEKTSAAYAFAVQWASGADTSNDTSYSATSSGNLSWKVGQMLLIAVAQNLDTGTQSAQSLTSTNNTLANRTNRASTAVTNGNDHRHIIDSAEVSDVGTASQTVTYAYTVSAAASGPTGFLLVQENIVAFPIAQTGNISVPASASVTGNIGWTTAFNIAQTGAIAVPAAISIDGDVQSAVSLEHRWWETWTTSLSWQETWGPPGAAPSPFAVTQTGEIALPAQVSINGDVGWTIAFDVAQTGSLAVPTSVAIDGAVGWTLPFNLGPTAAISLPATVTLTGDVGWTTATDFDVVQTGAIAVPTTVTIAGDLDYPEDFEIEAPLELFATATITLTGDIGWTGSFDIQSPLGLSAATTVLLTGDIDYTLSVPFPVAQSSPIVVAVTPTVTGDIAYEEQFPVAQSGAVALAPVVTLTGDVGWSTDHDLAQSGAIAIAPAITMTGDVGWSLAFDVNPSAAVAASAVATITGDIGYLTAFDVEQTAPLSLPAVVGLSGDVKAKGPWAFEQSGPIVTVGHLIARAARGVGDPAPGEFRLSRSGSSFGGQISRYRRRIR